jgi:hypothetical protein
LRCTPRTGPLYRLAAELEVRTLPIDGPASVMSVPQAPVAPGLTGTAVAGPAPWRHAGARAPVDLAREAVPRPARRG